MTYLLLVEDICSVEHGSFDHHDILNYNLFYLVVFVHTFLIGLPYVCMAIPITWTLFT